MPKSIIGTVVRTAAATADGSVEIRSADERLHRIPAHHARGSFHVGDRVEYSITTAGGIPTRAELRPVPVPAVPIGTKAEQATSPRMQSIPVRVREVPAADNEDCFVVEDASGTCWTVSFHVAVGYLKHGDRALLETEQRGANVWMAALRSESGQRKRFYRNPGRVRRIDRRTEVWSGYRWMTLHEANEEGLLVLGDVGRLVKSIRVGGGAYGGPGEYSIDLFLWRVAEGYLLDVREDAEGIAFYPSKEDAMERVEEIRRSFGKGGRR